MPSDALSMLFERAVGLPPDEQAAFVEEACGEDDTLRDELSAMLSTHRKAAGYFGNLANALLPGHAGTPPSLASLGPDPFAGKQLHQYQVLEQIGAGGMGVVYRAEDTRLQRTVALKFLPPTVTADASVKERFVGEARAAAALNHPNICTIYQIDEAQGIWYIAMEYVRGETLQARLAQGPLPVEQAQSVARQMARGLARAHAAEIVHRDIKPGNVMLPPDGPVKVLDFGLAKLPDIHLTQTGTTLGTAAYMSPEQMRGEPVDARADVWSVGVVLYEMLTGRRPFQGSYAHALLYEVLNETPPPVTELAPEIPDALADIVGRCLQKDPAERYPSATELLADLDPLSQADGVASAMYRPAVRRASPRWARPRVAGGLAAGLLLLLAAVLFLVPFGREAVPAHTYVAVLPFTSDNPEDQALADGLTQSVAAMLARFETVRDSLWVVPTSELLADGIPTAREARARFGVDVIVRVLVRGAATGGTVGLNLEDAVNTRLLRAATLPAPTEAGFQQALHDALVDLFDVPPAADVTPVTQAATPRAYTYYLQGVGYLRRYDRPGNLDNAVTLFRQALEEDATYAPAVAGLCEALWEKYRAEGDPALTREALSYCDRAATLASGDPGVLISLGSIYLLTGTPEKAETALQRARQLAPDNTDALRWLGRLYEDRADHAQAEAVYRQAIALKPHVWIYYSELGILLDFMGRDEEAIAAYEEVIRLTPDNFLAYNALGNSYLNLGQFDRAETHYRRALELNPAALVYRNLGRLYFLDGQYARAITELEQALVQKPNDLTALNWLGEASFWAGRPARAEAAWQQAVDVGRSLLEINPRDNIALILIADAYAGLGEHEQSLFYLQQTLSLPQEELLGRYFIGRIYERVGQRDLALRWIEQVLRAGFTPVVPEHEPWLEDLRADPRYQAIPKRVPDTPTPPG